MSDSSRIPAPTPLTPMQKALDEPCNEDRRDPCGDGKELVTARFGWMQTFAMAELNLLKADIERVDKPRWTDQLARGLLDMSFKLGLGLVTTSIAEAAVDPQAKLAVSTVKSLLDTSLEKGKTTAEKALGASPSPDPAEFIASQIEGVAAIYIDAQTKWITQERHAMKGTMEVAAIVRALDVDSLRRAAKGHYAASRDAYLSCLAQQTLGTTTEGTTNMEPPSARRGADGRAPSAAGEFFKLDRGVLQVHVMLHDDTTIRPIAWNASIAGANEKLRGQYENVPLASAHVPRRLVCSVRGGDDFVVNIDEAGNMFLDDGSSGEWLAARARAQDAANGQSPRAQQQRIGLQLLLSETVVANVRNGG